VLLPSVFGLASARALRGRLVMAVIVVVVLSVIVRGAAEFYLYLLIDKHQLPVMLRDVQIN